MKKQKKSFIIFIIFLLYLFIIFSCTTSTIKQNSMDATEDKGLLLRRKASVFRVKDRINKITIGITTKNEVLELFGDPIEINNDLYMFFRGG